MTLISHQILLYTIILISSIPTRVHNHQLPQITQKNLQDWSYIFDNTHRFILLSQPLIPLILPSLPVSPNIQYFSHDCSKNSTLLVACQPHRNVPIIVVYNKVLIQFDVRVQGIVGETLAEGVLRWVRGVVAGAEVRDLGEEAIWGSLGVDGDLFVLVENTTIRELGMGYNILAKQFPFKKFIYLTKPSIISSLNLKPGQFLHLKPPSPSSPISSLPSLLSSPVHTTTFPEQATLRYDYLKIFVLDNIFTEGFSKITQNLQRQRFDMKVRKIGEDGHDGFQRNVVVFCDLGENCVEFLGRLDREILGRKGQDGKGIQGTVFNRIIMRQDIIRNVQLLEVFFHIRLRDLKLPYMLVIDGQDPQTPNLPIRYKKQLSFSPTPTPLSQILDFLTQIDSGSIPNTQLISGIPKKNGFTGKGSQKSVQKLSYLTYKKVLEEHREMGRFYLLFVTAFQYDCPQCLAFYGEYKKLAAFLNAEATINVTLGVYDLSKDQIDLKYLKNVPSVFLFTPSSPDPIEYHNRYEFEPLLNFLKKETKNKSPSPTPTPANTQL